MLVFASGSDLWGCVLDPATSPVDLSAIPSVQADPFYMNPKHGSEAISQPFILQNGWAKYKGLNADDSAFEEYNGMQYNVIIDGSPNQNYGTTSSLQAGSVSGEVRKALIRFDLSAFARHTVSDDAVLTLCQRQPFGTPVDMTLYQIKVANGGWIGGDGSGKDADLGESAWNFKVQGSPQVLWAGSAGLNTSGVDYVAKELGGFAYTPSGVNGTGISIAIPKEVLQGWIDQAASNAGMLLAADSISSGAYGTFFNDAAHQKFRPKLEFSAHLDLKPVR